MKLLDLLRPRAAVAALCAPFLIIADAHAGRPMAADDAAILAPGQCQLEAGLQDGARDGAWTVMPACCIGAWELGAGVQADRRPDSGALIVQAKTALRAMHSDDWGLALVLSAAARSRDGGGGGINLPLGVSLWHDRAFLHLNAGVQNAGGRTAGTGALGAELALGPRAALTLERYGRRGDGDELRLGARYNLLPARLDLDLSYSRFAGGRAARPSLGLGLTWSGPAPLRRG